MDLPPWVNQSASSGHPGAAGDSGDPIDDTNRRLAAIEHGLTALGDRLDSLATSLETSVREAVAKDVERVATDLRHTVSDLGRLLVRDLGRLSKILSDHRDTILNEVKGDAPRLEGRSGPGPRSEGRSGPASRGGPPTEPSRGSAVASLSATDPVALSSPPAGEIPVADGSEPSIPNDESGTQRGWRDNRRRRRDT